MNEQAVLDAVKSLISANSAALLLGLTAQSQNRTIAILTTTPMTPPVAYYYVAIDTAQVDEASREGQFVTVERPPRSAFYQVTILVADYLIGVAGEAALYETMAGNFRKFCDRLADLIEKQLWITDATTGLKFRLTRSRTAANDRQVTMLNMSGSWLEAEDYHSLATSTLRFMLGEERVDTAALLT